VVRGRAEEHDAPPAERNQMPGGPQAAVEIIAAHRQPRLVGEPLAPTDEARAARGQGFEPAAILLVVAIAEQDDAVGPAARGEIAVPATRAALEGDQQVLTFGCAGPGDRAEHRQEEGVDRGIVRGGILEEQQRQRVRVLGAQVRGVLVDRVIQLPRDRLDPLPCLGAHRRAAAQGPRHGGLRHTGEGGDVEGSFLVRHRRSRPK
jgi:hypothetical protein